MSLQKAVSLAFRVVASSPQFSDFPKTGNSAALLAVHEIS